MCGTTKKYTTVSYKHESYFNYPIDVFPRFDHSKYKNNEKKCPSDEVISVHRREPDRTHGKLDKFVYLLMKHEFELEQALKFLFKRFLGGSVKVLNEIGFTIQYPYEFRYEYVEAWPDISIRKIEIKKLPPVQSNSETCHNYKRDLPLITRGIQPQLEDEITVKILKINDDFPKNFLLHEVLWYR